MQYYVDPDAVSYFTIVKRYLDGDINNAVNAFWSPMGIWLTVLFTKISGWELFPSAIAVNTLASLATLWASQALFHRYRNNQWERVFFTVFFALFWAYANYKQSFTDIWQYFFLLLYFLVLIQPKTLHRWYYWPILGLIGALAYFSKAYSFYYSFLLLLIFLFHAFQLRKDISFIHAFKIASIVLFTQLLVASPWLYVLYEKYDMFTLSTAGDLNLTWWLLGEPIFREDIRVVIPPISPNGIFYFEDSYFYQGAFPKFWHSPSLFIKQIIRSAYNYIGWNESSFILSSFYFITWIWSLVYFLSKNRWKNNEPIYQVWWFFFSYPLVFWLMTFDKGRYLWVTIPFMIIIALYLFDQFVFPFIEKKFKWILSFVLFLSVLVSPAKDLKDLWNVGQIEHEWAETLKELNIQGAFVSNKGYHTSSAHFVLRLAYFSDNPWYCHLYETWSTEDILEDAKRYQIPFYFYFYNGTGEDYELRSSEGLAYPELTEGKIVGLKVFKIN